MLKFADLMNPRRDSIDLFIQYFPNSYLPLFMMYLGRHDLVEIVENPDNTDKQVFFQISRQEIETFFKGSEHERPFIEVESEITAQLNDNLKKKDFDVVKEIVFTLPLFELLKYRDKEGIKNIGMRLREGCNQSLSGIYDILSIPEEQVQKCGKVLLFMLLWEIRWNIFIEYLYTEKDGELKTEKWISTFEKTLSKILAYSREKIWLQPEELTHIILPKKFPGRLYNPFAGLASYSVKGLYDDAEGYDNNLALGDEYIGQEIDPVSWAVGKLRLLAYGTDSNNYMVSDSKDWTDDTFPNIISTPPFGLKIMNEQGKMELADHFVVRRSIDSMEDGGMAAFVVPASFLTRKDAYSLRKRLATERLVDMIISLPEGLFLPYTNIKTAVIFLKKQENVTVKFIDASKYYKIDGRERKLLKNRVIQLIQNDELPDYAYSFEERSEFMSSFCLCRTEEIIEKDYSLNVRSYIRPNGNTNERYEIVYLSEIFFPIIMDREEAMRNIRPERHNETGRLVTLNNLSTNPLLPYLDYTSLKRVQFDYSLEAIQGPAMLFSLKGKLCVSLLKKDQVVFVVKNDIAAFWYNPDKYYGEYIVNELSKQYVKNDLLEMELEIERTPEDIELLHIISPIIGQNNWDWDGDRVSAQKEALVQEKDRRLLGLEQQLSDLKDKRHDDYIKSLRQRKHRIQQVMNELCPAFSLLEKRRNENGILRNEDIVGKRTGKTVNDYFQMIGGAIDKVEDMITHIVDDDEWGENEMLRLKEFLNNIPQQNLSDRYSVKVNYHINDEYGEDGILVAFNRDKFAVVFENIFSNALKWGFINPDRNDYCIRIDVDKPSSCEVRIRVANNGEPIHPSLNRERLFEWGIGNHTGYGTWQVKNIVEHYLGTVSLHEYPNDAAGFQTEYEITLPAYI